MLGKLPDINRSWRNQFFIIEHETHFQNIWTTWANEATFIKRSTKYIKDDLDFLGDLLAQCNNVGARANFYTKRFVYRHEHPNNAGLYEFTGGLFESEGIFLTLIFPFVDD